MTRYTGNHCPVCEQAFTDEDDIVVCPDCGTPYHRACWQKVGACMHKSEHAAGFEWQPEFGPEAEKAAQEATCPNCGTHNQPGAAQCSHCGCPLPKDDGPRPDPKDEDAQVPIYARDPSTVHKPDNSRTTPGPRIDTYTADDNGGICRREIGPEDTIDGIKAKDWAAYVGRSPMYYLMQFFRMSMTKQKVRPLVIKVASISAARMQVYFIDNEDYFKRKQIDRDDDGNFFNDNGERAIFFARGVLETVKKLRWAPDVIHCQGWITQILPLYLKKMYKDDPIFANSKIVLSLYDDMPEKFDEELSRLVKYGDITDNDIPLLADPTGINLAKTAVQYSDGVIIGSEGVDNELIEYSRGLGLPVLPYDGKSIEDGTYFDAYNSFYDKLG